ncbi:MAG: amidohydrolase family protein [Acidimicrobiales bacterium]
MVTIPGFVHSRGDTYLAEADRRDVGLLYRCASLLAVGLAVAGGPDAPFGSPDPWTAITTAHGRRTRHAAVLGRDEAVARPTAVALFAGHAHDPGRRRRRLALGEPGDLCLVKGGSIPEPGGSDAVLATVVAGTLVHHRT